MNEGGVRIRLSRDEALNQSYGLHDEFARKVEGIELEQVITAGYMCLSRIGSDNPMAEESGRDDG